MDGGGLTNVYIDTMARRFAVRGTFCGVFSSDTIPAELADRPTRFSLICNLSRERELGTHFVAITCTRQQVYYFDPVGLPCISADIARFLDRCAAGRRRWRRRRRRNERTIQHPQSSFCGFYTLLFVLLFDRGARWQTLRFLGGNRSGTLFANDAHCLSYLKREIMLTR
jgi:hypothetical protein